MSRKRGGVAIEKRDPELAAKALVMLADTGTQKKTGDLLGLHHSTVGAIAERNPDEFSIVKKERASQHFKIATRCLDQLETADLTGIHPVQLSVMSGIHTDKAIALTAKDPPTIFDYEGLNKVIRMHDVLMAELSRRSELINVTPTKEIASAEIPRGEATQGVREQPPRDIRDNEQNRGDARLEDHTQGPPDGSQTS